MEMATKDATTTSTKQGGKVALALLYPKLQIRVAMGGPLDANASDPTICGLNSDIG